jgi:hypothetical protein
MTPVLASTRIGSPHARPGPESRSFGLKTGREESGHRDRSGSDFTGAVLTETTDVDLPTAAPYGPPDRQPQATLEALLEGECLMVGEGGPATIWKRRRPPAF